MMNKSLFCGLLLATVFGACAQNKKAAGSNAGTDNGKKKQTGIKSIEIHRTACYGKCPDYILRITSEGHATYIGKTYAPYQGVYETKVDAGKVQELFADFVRFRVDTCAPKYKTIPDMAGLEYTIDYGTTGEKTISNANSPFAPKFLKGLAEDMDQLAPINDSWKKVEEN